MNVSDVVQRQLEAYNARDLERFAATYADSIKIFRMPSTEPAISGKAQLAKVYRDRFSAPSLHAEILARIVLGNKVIDHERVHGIREHPLEAVAIYEVQSDLIQAVWFFYPEQPFPQSSGTCTGIDVEIVTQSVITCPLCGTSATEPMPLDACVYYYECTGCGKLLRPNTGDCCVFCSFGSVKCPPVQQSTSCCSRPG